MKSHSHYLAQSFAASAERAVERGEAGCATSMYEHALNYEMDAINECSRTGPDNSEYLRSLYANAARYAEACGRHRKAARLLAYLANMADESSDAMTHP